MIDAHEYMTRGEELLALAAEAVDVYEAARLVGLAQGYFSAAQASSAVNAQDRLLEMTQANAARAAEIELGPAQEEVAK